MIKKIIQYFIDLIKCPKCGKKEFNGSECYSCGYKQSLDGFQK